MKKKVALLLVLLFCLTAFPVAALAAADPSVFEYTLLEDGTAMITRFTDAAITDLVIPSELDGHPVSAISAFVFKGYESLRTVTIPEGVTTIWNSAFTGCENLSSVNIPAGVTTIGDGAFNGCKSLKSITIPDSVTLIGNNPFSRCTNLKQIEVSQDHPYLSVIDDVLFCKPDKRLITYPLTRKNDAYEIPEGIEVIGDLAFFACRSLASVTIPDSVTTIGCDAFSWCEDLTSVTMPDSVTNVGYGAFSTCTGLRSVTISRNVTSIEYATFSQCKSLFSITIPEGVTAIGDSVFSHCDSLASVTIPDSVESIGDRVFQYCDVLIAAVGRDSCAERYCKANGISYVYAGPSEGPGAADGTGEEQAAFDPEDFTYEMMQDRTVMITGYTGTAENLVVPDRLEGFPVTVIGRAAFKESGTLISVTIPEGVTTIEKQAFYDCSSLESLTLPESITTIEEGAFMSCDRLRSFTIPEGITTIEYGVFSGCSFLSDVTIPDSVTTIGESAFSGCGSLVSIDIPDTVTDIGQGAFYSCASLKTIEIPEGVTAVRDDTFAYCSRLASVVLPDTVTTIGDRAFRSCGALGSVRLPDHLTAIGENAFWSCEKLPSITIPDSVTRIDKNAFEYCDALVATVGRDSYAERYCKANGISYVYAGPKEEPAAAEETEEEQAAAEETEEEPAAAEETEEEQTAAEETEEERTAAEETGEEPAAEEAADEPDTKWTCPTCGRENEDNFCPACGTKKPEPPSAVVCSGCGAEYEPDTEYMFCPKCGTKLKEEASPEPTNEVSLAAGDTVLFGTYSQTAEGGDETPIEWIVLSSDSGAATLISKYGLDAQPYFVASARVTWDTSSLRTWLNNDFLNAAFSMEEQAQIVTTTVTADNNPQYGTDPGKDTDDKVFLLSFAEAEKYLTSNEDRVCIPTKAATSNGVRTYSDGTCRWLLRSPGYYSDFVAYVDNEGSFDYEGTRVYFDDCAVRPVIVLRLS